MVSTSGMTNNLFVKFVLPFVQSPVGSLVSCIDQSFAENLYSIVSPLTNGRVISQHVL